MVTSSGGTLLAAFLDYDPDLIDPLYREELAGIFKARSETLVVSSEVAALRGRIWAGEQGLESELALKLEVLKQTGKDYRDKTAAMFKQSVDVDGLLDMLPMVATAVLRKFKVPPLLLLEVLGVDPKEIKTLVDAIKKLND